MRIGIIGCTSHKQEYRCSTREMYSKSTNFRNQLKYLEKICNCDKIYVLSAKHRVLDLVTKIEPYNTKLKGTKEDNKWHEEVIAKLDKLTDFKNDEFIIVCGKNYYRKLITHLNNKNIPANLSQGLKKRFFVKELEKAGIEVS